MPKLKTKNNGPRMSRDSSNNKGPRISRDSSNKMKEKTKNPFEMQKSRQKFEVLGLKPKDNSGLPGFSRHRGNLKREHTLLNEYKDRHKNSKFLDLRIGEKNLHMDPEKKIMLRMTAEKRKQFSKKSLYNLNDDEELMHGGEALTEASMRDKNAFSDDEDDEDLLDANFVKEQHFGGDIFTRKQPEDTSGKSRRDRIDDIIAESKKKKANFKIEKEKQNDAVSKLDSGFQNFLSLMSGKLMTDEDKEKSKKSCEFRDYDTYVRQMVFDRSKRAIPANKLKTEEEIINEQKEKLKALEEERLRRMKGEVDENPSGIIVQQSADSLLDGFYIKKDKRFHVSYKDGIILNDEIDLVYNTSKENSSEVVSNSTKRLVAEENHSNQSGSPDDSEKDGSDSSSDESDKYSDIIDDSDSTTESLENGDEMDITIHYSSENKEEVTPPKSKKSKSRKLGNKTEEKEEKKLKKAMEDAKRELPFTFKVPSEYDSFWNLLQGKTPTEVTIILERMIICNHPSLGHDKKDKLNTMFAYMLQTYHSLCSVDAETFVDDVSPFAYIDSFVPHFFTITQSSPADCASALTQVIDEKYEEYSAKHPKRYPYADTFIFLKLSGLLFPASDFHHVVMTRVKVFLAQLLWECKVKTRRDILALLFTSNVLFEYINRARRFLGELSNALKGIIYLCIPSDESKLSLPHTPPFKKYGPLSDLLVLQKCRKRYDPSKFTISGLNKELEIDDDFRIKALHESLRVLNKLCETWKYLPCVRTIFQSVTKLTKKIPIENYPEETSQLIEELNLSIANLPPHPPPLCKEREVVKTLRMFEPAVSDVIEGVRKRTGTRDYEERQKLLHKIKRERKGAKRELRRDTAFISRQQLHETLAGDAERKRKVNVIMQELALQESDFKVMEKKKSKK